MGNYLYSVSLKVLARNWLEFENNFELYIYSFHEVDDLDLSLTSEFLLFRNSEYKYLKWGLNHSFMLHSCLQSVDSTCDRILPLLILHGHQEPNNFFSFLTTAYTDTIILKSGTR
jgi:hypothetical protein